MTAVVECTAGQGTNVGRTFAELAGLIERITDAERAGVCLDTCHLFAAGYDLRTREGYERMLDEFDAAVGLRYLRGWHLNDSKGDLGSRVDRHAAIGAGLIGREPFTWIVQDPRFDEMPLILETPEPEHWATGDRRAAAPGCSLQGIEVGQVGAVVLHRRHRVAAQAHADVPRSMVQDDLALGQGKAYVEGGADRRFRDQQRAAGPGESWRSGFDRDVRRLHPRRHAHVKRAGCPDRDAQAIVRVGRIPP